MKKRIASLFTSLLMIVSLMVVMPTMSVSAANNIIIAGIDIGYSNGSYFTKNGKSCATMSGYWSNGRCHKNGVCDSATSYKCNCMRYYPTGNPNTCQVDLKASQCWGFARYCEWKVYGFHDGLSASKFKTTVGKTNANSCTESYIKSKFYNIAVASHLRTGDGGHSLSIISTDESGVIWVDCNSDGYCKVIVHNQTWAQFANYLKGRSGISYVYSFIGGKGSAEASSKPTNVILSKNQYWYDLKDTITLTPSSNGATSYVMSVEKDGKRIIDCISLNGAYSFAANKWGYGKYHAWISATNSAGTTDSSACDFEVVKAPSYSDVWCSKGFYDYDSNESIDIYIKASCTKGQTIGIDYLDEDLNPVKRVVTSNCGNSYKISTRSLGKGYFSAYFTIWNGSGSVDTKRTYFYVGQKQNVGTDFYARIKNNAANKYLTNSNGNVNGTTLDCSKQQIWKFVRQSDNSYKLISAYDNGAMDVKDYATSGSGTNVQMNSSWDTNAQKFYIYYVNKSYYFKPVCADLALDLSNKTSNLEVWGAGFNWNPQKFSIEKVNTNDIGVHKFSTWTTTKNATCTQVGTKSRKCTVCGKTETQTIAKTGHKSVTDKAIPATCTTDGKTEGSHCSVCGAVIKAQDTTKATGHKFGNWTTTKSATCTESGTQIRKCETCGATESKSLSAKGHTEVVDKAIPATCTTDGKTEGSHCSVCGAVIKAQDTIKATGHKFGNWTTTKSATCTESGTQIRKCETCGATESKSLSAKGHTEVVDKAIPATCTTDGKTEGSHCSVCGAVIKAQDTIKATGHKFGNWTTTKSATCTESGTQIRKCETCGATESKSLSAKGHTEVVDKAIPATCTTDGKTEGSHCSVCGAVIKAQTTITATGHKSSGWIVDKTASIGVKGSKHKECTVCKKVLETAEIPALSRISISKASVTLSTSTYAYDGKTKTPSVTVKVNGKTLKKDTDYTVSYSNNTKVGTATVKITGKGNYTGSVSKTYSIKNNFKKATVSGISNKSYTGKNITQSITVKYNGKTLKKGTDYTVSYSSSKSIGTATVKIAGKGSYTGTITKTFKINPAKQEIQKLTAKSKAFFVDWAQKGSATGYEIQYATNSKFTSAKKVTITNKKTDKTTISKLSGKKKYYVRVRSYTTVKGTKYYGAWSASKSVTTKK
ncbi:MAG: RICIN domain-containing protein [Ruminococcus sp.]